MAAGRDSAPKSAAHLPKMAAALEAGRRWADRVRAGGGERRRSRSAGSMGNCHTVGPNEALVVSGTGGHSAVGLWLEGDPGGPELWGWGCARPGCGGVTVWGGDVWHWGGQQVG